jgi:hypothetical protein
MKLSLSLSQRGAERLEALVRETGTNVSVVLELGLDLLFEDDAHRAEQSTRAERMLEDRRPRKRSGWRKLFWEMLADEMGTTDAGRGRDRYEMTPRAYLGFNVIFDASREFVGDDNGRDVLVFTDTAPPYSDKTVRISQSWIFRVGDPVSTAAHDVASWLRENAHKLHPVG